MALSTASSRRRPWSSAAIASRCYGRRGSRSPTHALRCDTACGCRSARSASQRDAWGGCWQRTGDFPSDSAAGPAMAVGPRGELAIAWMAFKGDEFGTGSWRVRPGAPAGERHVRPHPDGRRGRRRGRPQLLQRRGDVRPSRRRRRVRARAWDAHRRGADAAPRAALRPVADASGPTWASCGCTTAASGGADRHRLCGPRTPARRPTSRTPCAPRSAHRGPGASVSRRSSTPAEHWIAPPAGMRLAVAADGTAGVAWSNRPEGSTAQYPVRVVVPRCRGAASDPPPSSPRTGRPATWSSAAAAPCLSPGPATSATVRSDAPAEAFAALRPAGAGQPFGAPEAISPGPAHGEHSDRRGGLRPAHGPPDGRVARVQVVARRTPERPRADPC